VPLSVVRCKPLQPARLNRLSWQLIGTTTDKQTDLLEDMTMNRNARPLSPHLQIYKPQMTSVLSILHRGTGIVLTIGTLLLVYWLTALAAGPQAYASAQKCMGSWFAQLCLFGWSIALFYHLCNGIRHLFWDAGMGYDMKQAENSGRAVLIATAVLTAITWISV
jgi:succinate dehydrogenase / fumarate reductase cytochrome b subunit